MLLSNCMYWRVSWLVIRVSTFGSKYCWIHLGRNPIFINAYVFFQNEVFCVEFPTSMKEHFHLGSSIIHRNEVLSVKVLSCIIHMIHITHHRFIISVFAIRPKIPKIITCFFHGTHHTGLFLVSQFRKTSSRAPEHYTKWMCHPHVNSTQLI